MRPSVVNESEAAPQPPAAPEPFRATIYFGFGGAALDEESKATLDRVVKAAAANPNALIEIRGHSDARGDDAKNRQMSAMRADAAREYLAGHGVALERLATYALGEPASEPAVATGGQPDPGKQPGANNRRVDIVIEPAAPAPAESEETNSLL